MQAMPAGAIPAGAADERLVRSRYLQEVPRQDGRFAVYHSLFGNLKRVNGAVLELLRRFSEPARPRDVLGDGQVPAADAIRTLRDLYYLVPEGYDERTLVDEQLRERERLLRRGYLISALQLSISDACNFKCKYCFADRSDHRSEERRRLIDHPHKLMDFDTALLAAETLIDNAKRNDKERLVIKFFGREPLVNWPVMERLMNHVGFGERYGIKVRWDCTTNASLFTDEIAEVMARYRVNLYISVDSINEANDVNRPTKQGGKTFEVIDRAIARARGRGIEVFVSAVLSSLNFDQFDNALVDYAVKYGIRNVIVLLAMQDSFLMNQRTRSTEEIVDKLWEIYSYARSRGLNVAGYWHNPLRRLLLTTHEDVMRTQLEDHNSCTATGFQLSVEPSGDVFPCRAQSLHLGHISRFEDMLRSDVYRWQTMRTYCNVPACRGCEIEGVCQGECLGHSEEMYEGDIYRPDPSFCDIYRRVTRVVLERS